MIVVGHTECGGAKAALKEASHPGTIPPETALARYLAPLVELAKIVIVENPDLNPDKPDDFEKLLNILIKRNVKEQVGNVVT